MNEPKNYVMSSPEVSVASLGPRIYITAKENIRDLLQNIPAVRAVLDRFGKNSYEVYLSPLYSNKNALQLIEETLEHHFQSANNETEEVNNEKELPS